MARTSKTTTYVVRPATHGDVAAIVRIFVSSLDTSVPGLNFSNRPDYTFDALYAEFYVKFLPEDGTVTTLVALHPKTEKALGYVVVKEKGDSLPAGSSYSSTSNIEVPPDATEIYHLFVRVPKEGGDGKGVGSALMKRVLEEERWRHKGIGVICFERNERALKFYKKWGFEQAGRVDSVGGEQEPGVVFWLKARA